MAINQRAAILTVLLNKSVKDNNNTIVKYLQRVVAAGNRYVTITSEGQDLDEGSYHPLWLFSCNKGAVVPVCCPVTQSIWVGGELPAMIVKFDVKSLLKKLCIIA